MHQAAILSRPIKRAIGTGDGKNLFATSEKSATSSFSSTSRTSVPACSEERKFSRRKEGMESRTQSSRILACLIDVSCTLPATLSSERIYISPVPNNFFKLPVAEPKLIPTNFFSYVRSLCSTWASFPPSVPREVVVVGMLRAGRAMNSYGVPDRLSSLEVLAVGVWLSEGVVRLEMVLRP